MKKELVNKIKMVIVFAPSYDENIGGVIWLHKLCHLLNNCGMQSYIFPYFDNNGDQNCYKKDYLKNKLDMLAANIKLNSFYDTPVLDECSYLYDLDSWAVVYPEIVAENPLNAKNIIRWFLHYPGFHTGIVSYGKEELYFKSDLQMTDCNYEGSKTSDIALKVGNYPLDIYNMINVSSTRSGTAYCIRKGKRKKIVHDLDDSILIDGKSHEEIAKIFKNVKMFISYDEHTAYSTFAVLCGCISVVIPVENISEDMWRGDYKNRYGIAYGYENITKASLTSHLVLEHILEEEKKEKETIKSFLDEVHSYF